MSLIVCERDYSVRIKNSRSVNAITYNIERLLKKVSGV